MQGVTITSLILLLLLGHGLAQAGVYKWVDANGKTHFSDKAPAQENAERIEVDTRPSTTDPELEQYRQRNRALIKVWDEERSRRQKRSAEIKQQLAQQRQKCDRMRRAYRDSRRAGYLYVPRKNGEREIYSDAQRAEYERQMADYLRKRCAP